MTTVEALLPLSATRRQRSSPGSSRPSASIVLTGRTEAAMSGSVIRPST